MTELGQTADPRELISGSPEAIDSDRTGLVRFAERVEQIERALRGVQVESWAGAAYDGFSESWGSVPPKWLGLAESTRVAAGALRNYGETLRWAQGQAAEAIRLWDEGARASEHARTTAQPNQPYVDPGERARTDAQAVLDRARSQLAQAGDDAAAAIGGREVGTPGAGARIGGSLERLVDSVTGGWSAQGRSDQFGPRAGVETTVGEGGKLAQLKAYAQLGGATWSGAVRNGDLTASGKFGFDIGTQVAAAASLGKDGLVAKIEASAGARAEAEGHVNYGGFGLYGRAEGLAGLEANAKVQVGPDAVQAKAGAFAGVKGAVAGGADLGGLGVGATAEGWAGVGAEAEAGWSVDEDGKWHVGAKAGLALGIGGEVGFEITVDPEEIEHTARAAADALAGGAQAIADGVDAAGEIASDIGSALNPFD